MGRTMAVVLFTDLVGSTELRGRLGEEAADELRRTHDQLLGQAVEANNGSVIKGLGDGIMATFAGASDAVAAAVAIQQAVDRLNRSGTTTEPVAVRIGLSAGDVSFEEEDVHGTPVIEASRLCAAAGGGEILVAEVVRILAGSTGGHDFVSVGALELKGLDHPVAAVRVGWEPVAVSPIPMPALLTDPGRIFVGRDAELELLTHLWKEAAAGERRVALLAGEPGVGKTRLAAELAIRAHEEGALVLAGRCDEDLGVPYQPFVEALRHFIDSTPTANVKERLGRYAGELVRLFPELAERVALPPALQSDPETERYRLFDAVAAWLAALSAAEPLVLVLDDLQWAAKPTLLLFRHVVASADVHRIFIVGTYRDTELGREHPLTATLADLRRHEAVARISVSGLDSSTVAALMEQAAGRELDEDDLEVARAIYEETEGNPFFVREVLRHLIETGAIDRRHGHWGSGLPVEELGIPQSVIEVVGRRLARLSETANHVLRLAAVVGPEFELPVLQTAVGLDEDTVLAVLEEGTAARLIVVAADRYRFAHALVRDTLYGELSPARRVALHRRVAETIEAVYAHHLDDRLPVLAYHWARATAPAATDAKAADYARRAGDRALTQLAHDEAVAYYRQALELLDVVHPPVDEQRRMELLITLGQAERRAGDPAYRETLLDAARLARRLGHVDALCRAALANYRGIWSATWRVDNERIGLLREALDASGVSDSTTRVHLLAHLSAELIWSDDFERRAALADEAVAMARRLGDGDALAQALFSRTLGTWGTNVGDRLGDFRELLTIAERLGDQLTSFWAWRYRGLAEVEIGDLEAAGFSQQTCETIAEDLGQPALRWAVAVSRVGRLLLRGRLQEAEETARRAFELGQSVGEPDARIHYGTHRFQLRFEQGRLGEVVDRLRQAAHDPGLPSTRSMFALACCELGLVDEASSVFGPLAVEVHRLVPSPWWATTTANTAAVCAFLEDRDQAQRLIDLLAPRADHLLGNTLWIGCGWHYLGLLTVTLERWNEAEGHFAAAAALHERVGAPTWLARTRLEWARMLLARRRPGDSGRARAMLGQALGTARDLGLANIERRTVALLQECP